MNKPMEVIFYNKKLSSSNQSIYDEYNVFNLLKCILKVWDQLRNSI